MANKSAFPEAVPVFWHQSKRIKGAEEDERMKTQMGLGSEGRLKTQRQCVREQNTHGDGRRFGNQGGESEAGRVCGFAGPSSCG